VSIENVKCTEVVMSQMSIEMHVDGRTYYLEGVNVRIR